MRLTVCLAVQGTCTVVTLGGYSDLSTRGQLRDVLTAAATQTSHLVVDMSRLGFMDSTGLNVLVDVDRCMDGRGGTLALAAPQPIVAKVLRICGLDEVFTVHASMPEAMAGVAEGAETPAPAGEL